MPWDPDPGSGWIPDLPDPRDITPRHDRVREQFVACRARTARTARARRPASVDWSEFLPSPPDLQSQTAGVAAACCGLVEYYERRAFGRSVELGWAFLNHVARALARRSATGPVGFRPTFKALARFGLPPRDLCPPDPIRFDDPPALLFGFAREFAQLLYVRLDPPGTSGPEGFGVVKGFLAAGYPVALGVTVFDGLGTEPEILFPSVYDAPRGGQAVIAVGFDDTARVRSERGALRVRGGWGPAWGDRGFGWLPYRYLTDRLASDCWTLLRPDWIANGDFVAPF